MKKCKILLLCLFVTAHTNARTSAINPDAQRQQAVASSGINSETALPKGSAVQSVPLPNKLRHRSAARASLSNIKGGVVKEIKATSAFVQQAAKTESSDGWLIALVGFGLIILQLRRKHKSLPQRRIAPYG